MADIAKIKETLEKVFRFHDFKSDLQRQVVKEVVKGKCDCLLIND